MEPWVQDGAEALQKGCLHKEVSPAQWTVPEVCAWLGARHGDLAPLAAEHEVTGRALLRMTEGTLQRMGVEPCSRRWELLQELLGLRLQQELEELLCIVGREQHPQGHGDVPTDGLRSSPCPE